MDAVIRALARYLPEDRLTNEDLCRLYPDLTDADILRRTGVRERRVSGPLVTGGDLAEKSARALFGEQGVDPGSIDFLLLCTLEPDSKAPSTACRLQHRLGLPKTCGALEFNMGCSGFLYGLMVAQGLISGGTAKRILLLTAEPPTKVIHPKDFGLRMLFGDGAAATLVVADDGGPGARIGPFVFGTDGKAGDAIRVVGGGGNEPVTRKWLDRYEDAGGLPWGRMEMDGMKVLSLALSTVPPMVREVLRKSGLAMDDVDLFVLHQANGFLLETLRRKMKIPGERFFVHMADTGNTVSATIPIALTAALDQGLIQTGSRVLAAGFGVGYSYAGTLLTWA